MASPQSEREGFEGNGCNTVCQAKKAYQKAASKKLGKGPTVNRAKALKAEKALNKASGNKNTHLNMGLSDNW